jgi:hypothetical protein
MFRKLDVTVNPEVVMLIDFLEDVIPGLHQYPEMVQATTSDASCIRHFHG